MTLEQIVEDWLRLHNSSAPASTVNLTGVYGFSPSVDNLYARQHRLTGHGRAGDDTAAA